MPERMRTAIQYELGGPDVLKVVLADRPSPGHGQVLVRVHAASVNFGETKVRSGIAQVGPPPFTIGSDLSGVVVGVGEGVQPFFPGDEVYGIYFIGTYAEYVAVPAAALAHKPAQLDHIRAAAVPVAALTAWQAILERGKVTAGQRVLIHAAAGGVGHFAVQLAKSQGAYVLGTARAENHEFLRDIGVDEPIDYLTTDFTEVVREADVVLDLVGGDYGRRSLQTLKPGGMLLGAALAPGMTTDVADAAGREYEYVSVRPSGKDLDAVTELIANGRVRPHVDRTFSLDDLVAAHQYCESGHVTGKVVIAL